MTMVKMLALSSFAGAFLAATPAAAVVTTFATFSAPNSANNLRFVNSGNGVNRANDGTLYTTATGSSNVAGSVLVRFSFLQSAFVTQPAVQNVTANFTLLATVAKNSPAQTVTLGNNTFFDQPNLSGSFSFITTTAITVMGPNFATHTYAAGSNLLSATFTGADISGRIGGSSGGSNASTLGGDTVTYTSDFLDFTPTLQRDFGLTFTSVAPVFAAATGANKALRSFRTNASGQFSSDPAPIVNGLAVPEPAIWGMMIVGFGVVGFQSRRRRMIRMVCA